MPLDVRPNAVKVAVVVFFITATVAVCSGLPMCVSSWRSATAAVISYIGATFAIKAINSIVMSAMVTEQIKQNQRRKEDTGAGGN